MIVYMDEDGPYLSWVKHHRNGFVMDWQRQPTNRHPIVHRAACRKIRVAGSKKTHWTTGRRLKACSLELEKLLSWARDESSSSPKFCNVCRPDQEPRPEQDSDRSHQPTRLEKDIVDYVLEIAIIHLDNPHLNYKLAVKDVAEYLGKTTGQIAAAIVELFENGLLRLDKPIAGKSDLQGAESVFPTVRALKTEPAFEKLTERELALELAALNEKED